MKSDSDVSVTINNLASGAKSAVTRLLTAPSLGATAGVTVGGRVEFAEILAGYDIDEILAEFEILRDALDLYRRLRRGENTPTPVLDLGSVKQSER